MALRQRGKCSACRYASPRNPAQVPFVQPVPPPPVEDDDDDDDDDDDEVGSLGVATAAPAAAQ